MVLKIFKIGLMIGGAIGVVIGGAVLGWYLVFNGKVMPGVRVGEVDLGGVAEAEVRRILNVEAVEKLGVVELDYEGRVWKYSEEELGISNKVGETVAEAMRVGREGWRGPAEAGEAWVKGKDLQLAYELDSGVLEGKVATVAAELYRPEIEPELVWLADEEEDEGGKVAVIEGVKGRRVDRGKLKGEILSRVGQLEKLRLEVPIKEEGVSLSEKEKAAAVVRAETWGNKQLVVKANVDGDKEGKVVGGGGGDGLSWTWEKGDIWRLWDWQEGWDEKKVMARLEELAAQVDRPAENALFQFDSRVGRVSEFQPGVRGWEIDREKSVGLIVEAGKGLEEGEEEEVEVELVGVETEPEVETGGANDLGIEELLGQGRSRFAHSIASRIHNIAVASGKLNGILVKPGETFSFNDSVGDISLATGYQQAYVIRDGRTVLGDGGGVCQVSTTLFRAILAAGLPIVERHAHSYRVGYYEQDSKPGLDATVFAPSADLKFTNDTSAYILIQSQVDKSKMTLEFDLYGTSDERKAELGKVRVWDVSDPPPDLYEDDPTLPAGTVKQVDYKAWGAKAAFDWKVTRGEEVLQERTFYSNYQPWQAVFLRGTAGQ